MFLNKNKNYNSYEKDIMFNLGILNIGVIIITVLNVINLFLYSNKTIVLYLSTLFIIVSCIVGWFGAHGYISALVPLLPVLLIRLSQIALYYYNKSEYNLIIPVFILLFICELAYCIFLMLDRNMYVYIEEDEIMEDE